MQSDFEELAKKLFREKLEPAAEVKTFSQRQPVHVVYGGADRFSGDVASKFGKLALNSMESFAPDAGALLHAMGISSSDASERKLSPDVLFSRVREKLAEEPVEDFRADFEDGYGIRSDAEEDGHAVSCAREFASGMKKGSLPAFCGIRIKSFQDETFARAARTLELFLTTLSAETQGALPSNFVVTLPKVKHRAEVGVLAELLSDLEKRDSFAEGSIGIEIMVETPEILFDLREAVLEGRGRVTSAHFGAYDYTASLGITAGDQDLLHPSCDFARQFMQASLAPLGIRLSDSVTTEMPIPIHKGDALTTDQKDANRRAVHGAWQRHGRNIRRSLANGFYQSWDLHPAQLVARYAALTLFFMENAEAQGERLRRFVSMATQATLTGNVFDDAATAQGCLNFFSRAISCGAMKEDEASDLTGLSTEELLSGSFQKIMEGRD